MTPEEHAAPRLPSKVTVLNPRRRPDYVPADEDDDGLRLGDYVAIARRYKWSILALAVIAGIFGGLTALSVVPVYQADVKLVAKYTQSTVGGIQPLETTPMYWLFYETQYEIIRSRAVAERVVDALALDSPDPEVAAPSESKAPGWWTALRESLPDWREWIPAEWRRPEPAPPTPSSRREARVAEVMGGLTVQGGKESEVIVIGYASTDRIEAARIANAVADAYIGFDLEARSSKVSQTSTWLSDRLEELRQQLEESEAALQEFQAREGMVDSESREQIVGAKLGSLTGELIKAQARRSETSARYQEVRRALDQGPGYESLLTVLDSPLVVEAYRDRLGLERRVSELSERYGEKHPSMVAARADLREVSRRLQTEVDKAVSAARKAFELASAQEVQLRRIIDTQQSEIRGLSGKASQLAKREREVEANRRLYEAFLTRFKESDVADDYDVTNVRVIDRAQIPTTPFKPDRRRIVVFSVFAGLVLGFLLALLRERLDSTFKSREDVEDRLGLPVLGVLERLKLNAGDKTIPERYVLAEPRSVFAEAVNDIRTAILFSHVDDPPRVILVTSAVPDEGKTTLASNLALALRRRGTTLLLDADLRKGRLQSLVETENRPGLTDVVSGECYLEDAVHADGEADNLCVMTAGTTPPNPLEIISSQSFANGLDILRRAYDYIVVDGSPLLPVSDSVVLARLVDGVVLAVQAHKTTHPMVEDAIKRLSAAHIRPIGVVLQQADMRKLRDYGRGYAYYNYHGYYGYGRPTGSRVS